MKDFHALEFDADACRHELSRFRKLLEDSPRLEERKAVLPFFRGAPHLSAFIGSYSPDLVRFDRLAYEYSLDDFVCDLVIGDARRQAYCFVEFEDGGDDSIFVRRSRAVPEWSPRFEHGFSQLVDWMWALDDARGTARYANRFGTGHAQHFGMLVVGRGTHLSHREEQRLKWRLERVVVDSKKIFCITYDQLLADLADRLARYRIAYGSG